MFLLPLLLLTAPQFHSSVRLAIGELSTTCDEMLTKRDFKIARLGKMREAASLEATEEAERIAVEKERLTLDASRLSNDESQVPPL